MKKIIVIAFLFLSVAGYTQSIVEGDSLVIYGGGNFENTVQVPDPVNNLDAANKQWVLSQGGASCDSIPFNASTGVQSLYKGGLVIYSASGWDDRYLQFTDLADYVIKSDSNVVYTTPSYVDSVISATAQSVFSFTLPISGTLSGSVALITDAPSGWVITASGNDLQINHGLSRYSANVTVKYNTSGNSYRQLRNFADAYSGVLDVDNNNVTIESISTFYTAYALKIFILFE